MHGPWAALLILACNASEALVQHLRRLAECRSGDFGIDVAKVGVVEDIERVDAEGEVMCSLRSLIERLTVRKWLSAGSL